MVGSLAAWTVDDVITQGAVVRLMARLTGRFHLQRLAAIEEKMGRFGRAHREDLVAQRRQFDEVTSTVSTRASADAVGDLQRRVEDLQRAFAGSDVSEVLASVLAREPDWALLPVGMSPVLGTYIRRCLHKDPKQRVPYIASSGTRVYH